MPTLDSRIGLAAHDFASALGAPEVLITRARRDGRSPTVASRFLLRLDAISGGLPRDVRLERLTRALDDPGPPQPGRPARAVAAGRAAARPDLGHRGRPAEGRSVRFLRAGDPQAARRSTRSMPITPRAGRATAVHKVLRAMAAAGRLRSGQAAAARRAAAAGRGDPSDAARLVGAAAARGDRLDRRAGAREPGGKGAGRSRPRSTGEAAVAGVTVHGRADRIDRLADGGLAIIDYKTGAPPTQKAVDEGFALQLGLLGLIGRAGGFDGVSRRARGLRILVAGALPRQVRPADVPRQGHAAGRVPRPRLRAISRKRRRNG